MTSPALLTAALPADASGWWVSEKFDGVRAIWTGTKLLSRHGKDLKAPAWFTEGLPKNLRFDGELWMGRGTFDALVSTIQKKGGDWNGVQFMVFDLADTGTFEERFERLVAVSDMGAIGSSATVVAHRQLASNDDLDAMESAVVSAGGEGCVIRRPGSKYRPGRAGDTIKVKRIVADVDRWQG
jgi:DNA ligase-1